MPPTLRAHGGLSCLRGLRAHSIGRKVGFSMSKRQVYDRGERRGFETWMV